MVRPALLNGLFKDLTSLPDIGSKKAKLLEGLAGSRVKDLLFFLPLYYIDRRLHNSISEIENGKTGSIQATILQHHPPTRRRHPYRVLMEDCSDHFTLTFFNIKGNYLQEKLPIGAERILSGQVNYYKNSIQMIHPDYILSIENRKELPDFEPKYSLVSGLTQSHLRKTFAQLRESLPLLPEWLDKNWKKKEHFPSWNEAILKIHAPASEQDLKIAEKAKKRLAYDELFAHQLALAITRKNRKQRKGHKLENKKNLVEKVLKNAPFKPTAAQRKVFQEISDDMSKKVRMARLLQGDVGSGKTFIAALASAQACDSQKQTVIMAPTEILARQLAQTLNTFFKDTDIRITCLTGQNKATERKEIQALLKTGKINIICGTHALFQDTVSFRDLGLVIIDEQHRFGVSHRLSLTQKGLYPDLLVMTATPIPRTLALSTYGDLDISRLDEKPFGRLPITTKVLSIKKLRNVFEALQNALNRKERIYWVCPALEETEKTDLIAAEERVKTLKAYFGDQSIGLLHGKMTGHEKSQTIKAFLNGDIKLLVATTIIEVGLNIPDASIIIIEQAERFGLAQLHQLRGRVGRSEKQSSCLLLYKPPLNEIARERLDILRKTEDGFLIAEKDLALRGSGELMGIKQSGLPDYKIASLKEDADLLNIAIKDAQLLIHKDPKLNSERGEAARLLLYLFERDEGFRRLQIG